ncbi:MAG: ABC transporter ATP-binding protein [Acidobacteria bacterium]|nr:MAG: ABC transporter ATP-binding protein [Acidobacteriota bacterium]
MDATIRIAGLRKSYGEQTVLHDLDLEVGAGEVIGYIGPNGAGKSTTVKILTGMIDDFEGEATVCGFDVRRQPLEVKRRIGYIPETADLYDALTARQYLRFLGRLHGLEPALLDRRAESLLGLLGLEDLDQTLASFSKGMRQKVVIVAALIHDPQVIFMDEPLSGLDANTVVVVKEVITRLAARGKTVFYCSHVMDVVERVCHRIVILDRGRILADGSFDDLQAEAQSAGASLERIFTRLTSAGQHGAVAERFVAQLGGLADGAQEGRV